MRTGRRSARETKILYLQIYEKKKRRWSTTDIAKEFDCTPRTVQNAVKYAVSLALDLQKDEDIQLLIDSKEDRIRRIHERIEFLEDGWEIETTRLKEGGEHGSERTTTRSRRFSPSAEALFYREIRELEDDIAELRGLLNHVEKNTSADTLESDPLDEFGEVEEGISRFQREWVKKGGEGDSQG